MGVYLTVSNLLLFFANCKYLQEQIFLVGMLGEYNFFCRYLLTWEKKKKHSHMDICICYLLFAIPYCSFKKSAIPRTETIPCSGDDKACTENFK